MHKIDFVRFWGAQDAHRAHRHTTRLCVFLCVCVLRPEISEATLAGREDNPRLGGAAVVGGAEVA